MYAAAALFLNWDHWGVSFEANKHLHIIADLIQSSLCFELDRPCLPFWLHVLSLSDNSQTPMHWLSPSLTSMSSAPRTITFSPFWATIGLYRSDVESVYRSETKNPVLRMSFYFGACASLQIPSSKLMSIGRLRVLILLSRDNRPGFCCGAQKNVIRRVPAVAHACLNPSS